MIRVSYLLPGDPGGRSADQLLALLPTVERTVAALHDTGEVQVTVIARVGAGQAAVRCGYHFVDDGRNWPLRLAVATRAANPDVVHLNGLVFPQVALALRAVLRRPLVAQHHGELPPGGRAQALHRLANRVTAAQLFTGATHGQADPWRPLGVRNPFEVLEASADVAPEPRVSLTGGLRVLWVGRLIPGKDPLAALDAFAGLRATVPKAQLTMVTTDRQLEPAVRARLTELCLGLGAGRPVDLVGPVAQTDMAGWYRWADVYLSTSHHEGSGYALLEALASGCTPVVSDLPSHRAIAGALGRFFATGDTVSATAALCGPPLERDQVRADFDRRLTWSAVAEQLLAAYRSVL